jgi:hypothetical protein
MKIKALEWFGVITAIIYSMMVALNIGVELKWFGNDDPSGFTSNHKSWKYVSLQRLNVSDKILSGLFDLRLPLTFSIDDCKHISKIIIECSSQFIK